MWALRVLHDRMSAHRRQVLAAAAMVGVPLMAHGMGIF